ncbi:hypothetical protein HYH03_003373 [Edaphochlamys debaryana]|uniref:Uncharacterized protein n=1 Tax=Edaphochlamys debaryana TaxID=47281 RepID=A0A836C314_9CHLO|nr:hypothetical protein HYH03_003373 [Edaphochlamys debaryana]|eukprot:KAG2498626.1 hypothetical protein HYH03_003373 [Edaphochlamys debaryana]
MDAALEATPLRLEGVMATTTDVPLQGIDNTLADNGEFWSSTGSPSRTAGEALLYRVRQPLAALAFVSMAVYRANYQHGDPMYPPTKVSFLTGPTPTQLYPASPLYPCRLTDAQQVFALSPTAPVSHYLLVRLHGRQQRQWEDLQFYIAIRHVAAYGTLLPPSYVGHVARTAVPDGMTWRSTRSITASPTTTAAAGSGGGGSGPGGAARAQGLGLGPGGGIGVPWAGLRLGRVGGTGPGPAGGPGEEEEELPRAGVYEVGPVGSGGLRSGADAMAEAEAGDGPGGDKARGGAAASPAPGLRGWWASWRRGVVPAAAAKAGSGATAAAASAAAAKAGAGSGPTAAAAGPSGGGERRSLPPPGTATSSVSTAVAAPPAPTGPTDSELRQALTRDALARAVRHLNQLTWPETVTAASPSMAAAAAGSAAASASQRAVDPVVMDSAPSAAAATATADGAGGGGGRSATAAAAPAAAAGARGERQRQEQVYLADLEVLRQDGGAAEDWIHGGDDAGAGGGGHRRSSNPGQSVLGRLRQILTHRGGCGAGAAASSGAAGRAAGTASAGERARLLTALARQENSEVELMYLLAAFPVLANSPHVQQCLVELRTSSQATRARLEEIEARLEAEAGAAAAPAARAGGGSGEAAGAATLSPPRRRRPRNVVGVEVDLQPAGAAAACAASGSGAAGASRAADGGGAAGGSVSGCGGDVLTDAEGRRRRRHQRAAARAMRQVSYKPGGPLFYMREGGEAAAYTAAPGGWLVSCYDHEHLA